MYDESDPRNHKLEGEDEQEEEKHDVDDGQLNDHVTDAEVVNDIVDSHLEDTEEDVNGDVM